jgi:uncharacterized protein YukE
MNEKDELIHQNKDLRLEMSSLHERLLEKDQLIGNFQKQLNKKTTIDPRDRSLEEATTAIEIEYQQKILDLEMKCNNLSMELDTVRSQLETTEGALLAKDQLYDMRSAVYDLESNEKHVSRVVHESENHIRQLEAELQSKSKYANELQESVSNLKLLLEDVDIAKENEMIIMRKEFEIEALKQELASMKIKVTTTEEQLQRIVGTTEGIAASKYQNEMDYLQSNIVAVALALEQSELNRADTLKRLVSEREAYAVQLRAMCDKLKQFYSTVTFRDL